MQPATHRMQGRTDLRTRLRIHLQFRSCGNLWTWIAILHQNMWMTIRAYPRLSRIFAWTEQSRYVVINVLPVTTCSLAHLMKSFRRQETPSQLCRHPHHAALATQETSKATPAKTTKLLVQTLGQRGVLGCLQCGRPVFVRGLWGPQEYVKCAPPAIFGSNDPVYDSRGGFPFSSNRENPLLSDVSLGKQHRL